MTSTQLARAEQLAWSCYGVFIIEHGKDITFDHPQVLRRVNYGSVNFTIFKKGS